MITFREYITIFEQGTNLTPSGMGSGGRLGQSQYTPERPIINPQSPQDTLNQKKDDLKVKASPFNVSSKGQTSPASAKGGTPGPVPASPLSPGWKPNWPALPSPLSPIAPVFSGTPSSGR